MITRAMPTLLGLIILLAPLPLGANRIWAGSTIVISINFLFIWHISHSFLTKSFVFPKKFSYPVLIPMCLLTLWLFIQIIPIAELTDMFERTTLSYDPSLTQWMLLKTLSFTQFVWLGFYYLDSRSKLKKFVYIIIVAGFFQAIYGILLNLNVNAVSPIFKMPYSARAQGTYIYYNQYANYLALCLSLGIGILISQLSKNLIQSNWRVKIRNLASILLSSKIILRLALIIMVIALILSRSRMGNAAFFVSLTITSLYAFFYYRNPPKYLKYLIISFFALDLLLIGNIFGLKKLEQRIQDTSLVAETRDEVIRDTVPMIKKHPLSGFGGGSYYSSFPSFQSEHYAGFYDHTHNDYLEFTADLGIPMVLILGWMVIYSLIISMKVIRQSHSSFYQGMAFASMMAIIHMLVHSTVDFSLQSPANGLVFLGILMLSNLINNLSGKRN